MEQITRWTFTVLVAAQQGPGDGKPFFAMVNVKVLWEEYEAKFHHQVARMVLIEQGCSPSPMACCDLDDLPDAIKQGMARVAPSLMLPVFAAEPHHYDLARQQSQS